LGSILHGADAHDMAQCVEHAVWIVTTLAGIEREKGQVRAAKAHSSPLTSLGQGLRSVVFHIQPRDSLIRNQSFGRWRHVAILGFLWRWDFLCVPHIMEERFMKPCLRIFGIWLGILMMVAPVVGTAAPEFKLSMTSHYMDKHIVVQQAFLPWAKEIGEATGGRVEINYFNPNTLNPEPETYAATVKGTVDIGGNGLNRPTGKFPLSTVMDLPMMAKSATAAGLSSWELYNTFPAIRDELKDVKVLFEWAGVLLELHTTKPVKSLEELKGMKIIAWSSLWLEMLKHLGASPIQVTAGDAYMALQKGMADGVLVGIANVRPTKIYEACKYTTIIDLGTGSFWAAMNLDRWNSLPGDIREIIERKSGEAMVRRSGKVLDESVKRDIDWLKKNGHTFIELPKEELERWVKAVQPMHGDWIKQMKDKGLPQVDEIHEAAVAIGRKHSDAESDK
jgi:TRAP-type C4-dicarboxylate transport system substrate-binding protein